MAVQNKDQITTSKDHSHDDLDLRGTLYSVFTVGGIFVVLWVVCFIIFLLRM
ncbi:hypothetical protein GCM10010896_05160 [Mammaliicoccus stepanovicii]|uniref:Cytochrome c oxidase subunit 2A n=1 Tax=Mammaliicoccus stepanovicii TaxID=643214 RepID=A0A239ZAN1_9STAP|nr:cytochrome c oxidase subunit 2A [Mammaliicoccus stepanovicii]GGI39796.1 hypothetical protein GCM10010896_05160 [Mammaliicoccus stepanovicii]SNV67910.1 Uncharacterised protein [Mammaliicoccus stepanovicii]